MTSDLTSKFSGPLLKFERADQHIRYLETLLERYVRDNRKVYSLKNQEQARQRGKEVKFVPAHKHVPTVLGDAVHNLRTTLDHAYCILMEANGGAVSSHTRFPFRHEDKSTFKKWFLGATNAANSPGDSIVEYIINEAQPYIDGKRRLLDLHKLDIADKHTTILPVAATVFLSDAQIVHPDGSLGTTFSNVAFSGFKNPIQLGSSKMVFKFGTKNAFDVLFGQGQPCAGESIMGTLQQLKLNVKVTLKELEYLL